MEGKGKGTQSREEPCTGQGSGEGHWAEVGAEEGGEEWTQAYCAVELPSSARAQHFQSSSHSSVWLSSMSSGVKHTRSQFPHR